MTRTVIALNLLLVLVPVASAQQKLNFSGTWVLDTAKSDFGDFPAPDSQTHSIVHKVLDIKLSQTITGSAISGGKASSERHYTTDGKENRNTVGPQEVRSTSTWDGDRLVTVTKLDTADGTIEIRDTWELAENGRQMVTTRTFKAPQGDRTQRLVFTKKE